MSKVYKNLKSYGLTFTTYMKKNTLFSASYDFTDLIYIL